jgi:hypothetical protein
VRSFQADQPKSNAFFYGLTNADEVLARITELAQSGLYTIVNETIDVHDGGVSGVSYGGIVEFAPDDTPRAVEKPGTAAFSRDLGLRLLETVYGFRPSLPDDDRLRIEFSIHPLKRGVRHQHTIVWEEEEYEHVSLEAIPSWPNRFSHLVGDKTFGLLVADLLGLPVPRTTALTRRLAPFTFGEPTGSKEHWLRTAPAEQAPGKFITQKGWADPFELLSREDPSGEVIAAVLAQEAVDASYSGASATDANQEMIIEGVVGRGDAFMLGDVPPQELPRSVVLDVASVFTLVHDSIGPARFEWVHDGGRVWIVQLHSGSIASHDRTVFPGKASVEHPFSVDHGLEELRQLVTRLKGTTEGVVLVGNVGLTSHFGDILRRARIPSRVSPE